MPNAAPQPEPNELHPLRHALYLWACDDVGLIALVSDAAGRSTGSKDHAKAAPVLSAELTLLEQVLQAVTLRIAPLDWHRYCDYASEYLSALTF